MRKDLRHLLEGILDYAEGYLDVHFVNKLVRAFDAKKRVDFSKIWYIYVFCVWRKQWNI